MNLNSVIIEPTDLRKLLSAGGDAAIVYLYLKSGNALETAGEVLLLSEQRIASATATLRQLNLWQEQTPVRRVPGEGPRYTEQDILKADKDVSFRALCDEVQRVLGRPLYVEELKILLSFTNYLGLPEDVVSVLVGYCRDRARRKGSLRNPSLRSIEKEAYLWAERGIDSVEAAAAYIQAQNLRYSRLGKLLQQLQIRGRNLTAAEEKYALAWLEMDFSEDAIALAYERTCLNTGGLSWAYMHKILTRWHDAGWHTAQQVQQGDKKPGTPNGERKLDSDEIAAIQKMMQGV